jgi:Putative adhesin
VATQVFETPGSVSLQIRLPSGRVVVTTADEPRTIVSVSRRGSDDVEDIEIRSSERAGGHVIAIEQRERIRWGPIQISWGGDVEVEVTCPPGSNLDFSGASAGLRVDGDLGEVAVKTASGDVKLGDVAQRLQAKTASGDLSIGELGGGGQIVTVSGDIELAGFDGELVSRTVSGDVEIGYVRGPIAINTTSGDATLRALSSFDDGEVRVQTVSGDVRVGVGRGTRVWIEATSVSGDLESDLGLEDQPGAAGDSSGPVIPLHVKTVSGDVRIGRAAEAYSS